MTKSEKDKWQDFAYTLRVLTASALARYDSGKDSDPEEFRSEDDQARAAIRTARFVPMYEVTLRAASDSLSSRLPKSEVAAKGGGLSVLIAERAGQIIVTLQLKGFTALRRGAGREARLVSANGAVNCEFRFSNKGTGVCELVDDPEVRQGLARMTVQAEKQA